MDFMQAVRTVFSKYATFEGRARRAEYWYFALFTLLVHAGLWIVFFALPLIGAILRALFALAVLVPSIAVGVRRLHDKDLSGWFALLFLIPIVNLVLVFVWLCTPGTAGPNRFGPDPLDETGPQTGDGRSLV